MVRWASRADENNPDMCLLNTIRGEYMVPSVSDLQIKETHANTD